MAGCVVGVVKRHRTLYVAADRLPVIASLSVGAWNAPTAL
jgi:hypothetical protein